MIEKNISFREDSLGELVSGCEQLAKAVTSTLGANGQTVIIEDQFGNPHVTKDGVTVANSILLSDPVQNLGVSIMRQASRKTADEAGDGTTTSCALAMAMINNIVKHLPNIRNVHTVKRAMEYRAWQVTTRLLNIMRDVEGEGLFQVATVSANGDRDLGMLIAQAYSRVGKNGIVTMEDSFDGEDSVETILGTRIKRGYGTPFSVNNIRKNTVEYQNPLIVLSDFKIDMHERLHFAFEASIKQKRPLLIIADLDDRVKLFLTQNLNKKNVTANFFSPEGVGVSRFELLEDLALMTGAKVMSQMSGDSVQNINASYLGTCEKMVSTSSETILIFGKNESEEKKEKKQELIKWLEEEIKTASKHQKYHYEDRLSKLSGGVASIKVSGNSEVELKEKKDRVDDSINATKAALLQGIVPGGGSALVYAYKRLQRDKSDPEKFPDEAIGQNIIDDSLLAPLKTILDNSKIDHSVVDDILSSSKRTMGYNVATGKKGCMFKMGIVDPYLVTANAVTNACSVAATILTTSCVISNKRENESNR